MLSLGATSMDVCPLFGNRTNICIVVGVVVVRCRFVGGCWLLLLVVGVGCGGVGGVGGGCSSSYGSFSSCCSSSCSSSSVSLLM